MVQFLTRVWFVLINTHETKHMAVIVLMSRTYFETEIAHM